MINKKELMIMCVVLVLFTGAVFATGDDVASKRSAAYLAVGLNMFLIVAVIGFFIRHRLNSGSGVVINHGEAVNYIIDLKQRGLSAKEVASELHSTGWKVDEIKEAFAKAKGHHRF